MINPLSKILTTFLDNGDVLVAKSLFTIFDQHFLFSLEHFFTKNKKKAQAHDNTFAVDLFFILLRVHFSKSR